MMLLYWATRLERIVCEAASATGLPAVPPAGVTSAKVPVPLSATVFAAAVVPVVRIWLALSLVEVKPMDPLLANAAVNPIPAEESAVLNASIELTLPAATVLLTVMVVAAPAAGVKTKVLPLSELVPALVISAAVPITPSAPEPVGAAVVAEDFTEYPVGAFSTWLAIDFAVSTSFCSEVMPVLAPCSTCTPLPIPSRRLLMSLARPSSDWAVKKFVGLSSAVFTFLPVERRLCVVASRSAVDCSESKFWRTDDERTMPDILIPFWMNTIDATPRVSVGDRATLFRPHYPFVKLKLSPNT